jgi:uncharacterized membrane protein YhaH (DUF805 family)
MLDKMFSSKGRIRRSQYIPIYILLIVAFFMTNAMVESGIVVAVFIQILLLWIFYAQGARRAHDRGSSGWMQLVPFYSFYLLFADSVPGSNLYGDNPKGIDVYAVSEEPEQSISDYKPVVEDNSYNEQSPINKGKVEDKVLERKTESINTSFTTKKSNEIYPETNEITKKKKLSEETIRARAMRAIREGRDIIISYTKYNGEHSKRRVSNVELLSNDYAEWGYSNAHIRGYCHLRNEERTFRISRIKNLEVA